MLISLVVFGDLNVKRIFFIVIKYDNIMCSDVDYLDDLLMVNCNLY